MVPDRQKRKRVERSGERQLVSNGRYAQVQPASERKERMEGREETKTDTITTGESEKRAWSRKKGRQFGGLGGSYKEFLATQHSMAGS